MRRVSDGRSNPYGIPADVQEIFWSTLIKELTYDKTAQMVASEQRSAAIGTVTSMFILSAERYFEGIVSILKGLRGESVIYVTTNKPYSYLIRVLHENGISTDGFFFIDCISQHVGERSSDEEVNCIFLETPSDLTTISIAAHEAVTKLPGDKVLLLDSLSVLLIYNDANAVGKFSNFIINRLRTLGVKTILLALETDSRKDIISQIESLCDEVKR